jgi:hypothetical protein
MGDRYKELFEKLNHTETPVGLEERILLRIKTEERHFSRVKSLTFGVSTVTSLGIFLWTFVFLTESLKESGFWQYISLLFSENGTILIYWRELFYSLAESLPIIGLIIVLMSTGFFIWSLTNLYKNGKYIQIKEC